MKRIRVAARLTPRWHESGIHGDSKDIVARRHHRLPVAPVENEVLTAELPDVRIGPTAGDALVARDSGRTAGQKDTIIARWARIRLVFLVVDHAKPSLGSAPHLAGSRVDELVERIVSEVKMLVTGRIFVQPVIGGDVRV